MTTAAEWQARVGQMWAAEWLRTERAFAGLVGALDSTIGAVAPISGHALDIGSGAGSTAIALARMRPSLQVTGVDLSPELVAVANGRERPGTVVFHVGDAERHAAGQAPLAMIVSRHGVMFFDHPTAAFARLHAAAAPAAALVFSCFGDWHENAFAHDVAAALGGTPPMPDVPGPFAFANPDRVGSILRAAGWRDARAQRIDFAFRAGAGADPEADALAFLGRIGPAASRLRTASAADRPHLTDRLRMVIARHHAGGVVDFPAAAWIWTARAQGRDQ